MATILAVGSALPHRQPMTWSVPSITMARYWTADLHFGHTNIIRYSRRPFADVAAMNDGLVARWNEVVDPDDEVWVLGDVAMGPILESLANVTRLHGTKVLVAGNHDRCWSGHGPKAEPWVERYLEVGFAEILQGAVAVTIGGVEALACHFPYEGDSHDEDRFTAYRPIDDGLPLVHGHVHRSWKVSGHQLNVGVDVWDWRPITDDQVLAAWRLADGTDAGSVG
jgi:calcineurin-like phosphoesterase family protein